VGVFARSLKELSRNLNVDPRLRKLCLIEDDEKGYPRSVLSRFTRLVGAERLRKIIDEKVVMILRRNGVEEVDPSRAQLSSVCSLSQLAERMRMARSCQEGEGI
jgi:hypothetical protein